MEIGNLAQKAGSITLDDKILLQSGGVTYLDTVGKLLAALFSDRNALPGDLGVTGNINAQNVVLGGNIYKGESNITGNIQSVNTALGRLNNIADGAVKVTAGTNGAINVTSRSSNSETTSALTVYTLPAANNTTTLGGVKSGSASTVGQVVFTDGIGSVSKVGAAETADQFSGSRTIAISGAVTGSSTWNGSGNLTINTTLASGNDYIDSIAVDVTPEAGYCYCFDGEHYFKSDKYLASNFIGIHSDTSNFAIGEKGNCLKVAVAGFTLAYVDKEYETGTPLTCTKDGLLTEISKQDKIEYPERIVAIYWKPEHNETWKLGDLEVPVNGRHWIKIK